MNDYKVITESDAIYIDTSVISKIDFEEKGSGLSYILVYYCVIRKYFSLVGFGEWLGVMERKIKETGAKSPIYMYFTRQLMKELEMNQFSLAEPVDDQDRFIKQVNKLWPKYSRLGGRDLWDLMSALELQKSHPKCVFLSFDKDLVQAAKSEGLRAVDCNKLNSEILESQLRSSKKLIY